MLESILAGIDAEIARLQSARNILSSVNTPVIHKLGRPAKVEAETLVVKKHVKHRTMSAETKERMRQAQIKRWSTAKKPETTNLNATVAPQVKATKKKATKSAA